MKILAISDVENDSIEYGRTDMENFDLIISCGDLRKDYLEHVAATYQKRLLFIKGNHDFFGTDITGCEYIDGKTVNVNGVRILGIGSVSAFGKVLNERQMMSKVKRLKRKIIAFGGIDIIVTHHPAEGIGDLDDTRHKGYSAFKELLDEFSPKFMLYGHVHLNYDYRLKRKQMYKDTCVINAYEKCLFEV